MYKTPVDRSTYFYKASDHLTSLKNSTRYGQTICLRCIYLKEKNYEESQNMIKSLSFNEIETKELFLRIDQKKRNVLLKYNEKKMQ